MYHNTLARKITNLLKNTNQEQNSRVPTPCKTLKNQKRTVIYTNVRDVGISKSQVSHANYPVLDKPFVT